MQRFKSNTQRQQSRDDVRLQHEEFVRRSWLGRKTDKMIRSYAQQMATLHESDPFIYGRVVTHLQNGIETDESIMKQIDEAKARVKRERNEK